MVSRGPLYGAHEAPSSRPARLGTIVWWTIDHRDQLDAGQAGDPTSSTRGRLGDPIEWRLGTLDSRPSVSSQIAIVIPDPRRGRRLIDRQYLRFR